MLDRGCRNIVVSYFISSSLTAALAEPALNFDFILSEDLSERYVNACVEINSLPSNGLECDTLLYFEAQSDTASMLTFCKTMCRCVCGIDNCAV